MFQVPDGRFKIVCKHGSLIELTGLVIRFSNWLQDLLLPLLPSDSLR